MGSTSLLGTLTSHQCPLVRNASLQFIRSVSPAQGWWETLDERKGLKIAGNTINKTVELPNYYTEDAVFQADKPASFWGFTSENNKNCPVQVIRRCTSWPAPETRQTSKFLRSDHGNHVFTWQIYFSPMPSGQRCQFTINQVNLSPPPKVGERPLVKKTSC